MTIPAFQPPSQPPGHPPTSTDRRLRTDVTKRRECETCGWPVDLADGQYVPPHNQLVMTKRGPQFSDRPCDGSRQAPLPTTDKEI
jgi:hypothetical protein